MREKTGKAYSVSQINQYIRNMFLSDYALNHIYIKGEVSNCKYHSSGHIYFTLKDEKSQMACVMFAGQRDGLSFPMKEGQSVIAFGSISVYERDGKYQLYANEIRLDGVGALYERFEQLKVRLEEEGLFAQQYKKPIPAYVKKVGIVTADTGAAIQDIINIASRRNPFIQLILYPAKVQGEGAFLTIVKGIEKLDTLSLDVIIVGRGGGSIEDLWAFNEEAVARAIFECSTPVISAVGHETDTTISDYAADLRAPTPSAAAELAVGDLRVLLDTLKEIGEAMSHFLLGKIRLRRNAVDTLKLKLEYKSPRNRMVQKRQFLLDAENKLESLMKERLLKQKHQLALYAERMKGISPLEKLSRGYACVSGENGTLLKSAKQTKVGDRVKISFLDGEVEAVAEKITLKSLGVKKEL